MTLILDGRAAKSPRTSWPLPVPPTNDVNEINNICFIYLSLSYSQINMAHGLMCHLLQSVGRKQKGPAIININKINNREIINKSKITKFNNNNNNVQNLTLLLFHSAF